MVTKDLNLMKLTKKGQAIVDTLQKFSDSLDEFIPPAKVLLMCNKQYHDADKVEFLDISEDISGRDVMTFTCPTCGVSHDSLILT